MKKQKLMQQTDLYSEALRRYEELLQIKAAKEDALAVSPPGKIHIVYSRKRPQYYLRKNPREKTGEYIPKADVSKLKIYLQKSYDEKLLSLIDREIRTLEAFLRRSDDIQDKIRHIYSGRPDEIKAFTAPVDVSDDDYRKAWESIPYTGKEISDYTTFYETDRKEQVRSKSELNIANALAANGIPYKYECPLLLKSGVKLYPDFTVLNVKERKQIYWEHRGMMDDKEYAKESVMRIKTYMKNGIFIGRDLIISEETAANPLGTNEINAIIQEYFQT
ncbi:MAG: hypothetical protein IK115_02905 [Lachnospiraceae bacterium]|nr:hypothetical protein [Lachnospiraceae bacterium]